MDPQVCEPGLLDWANALSGVGAAVVALVAVIIGMWNFRKAERNARMAAQEQQDRDRKLFEDQLAADRALHLEQLRATTTSKLQDVAAEMLEYGIAAMLRNETDSPKFRALRERSYKRFLALAPRAISFLEPGSPAIAEIWRLAEMVGESAAEGLHPTNPRHAEFIIAMGPFVRGNWSHDEAVMLRQALSSLEQAEHPAETPDGT